MLLCVPIRGDGSIDPRWGRADRLAVAEVVSGVIASWHEVDVSWDELHDQGTEGAHHARVVSFLREQGIEAVVADHMGGPMLHTLGKMGIEVHLQATGNARAAILAAATG
ncbi:MAG TPA: NifB/NifX family molybdenum-iron cluster-binding protein [Mycobacteriales bacterium]|nr:NifB/NifX family molybdenum-iron cluster-binding protein [Mycobacteriales bacterium]